MNYTLSFLLALLTVPCTYGTTVSFYKDSYIQFGAREKIGTHAPGLGGTITLDLLPDVKDIQKDTVLITSARCYPGTEKLEIINTIKLSEFPLNGLLFDNSCDYRIYASVEGEQEGLPASFILDYTIKPVFKEDCDNGALHSNSSWFISPAPRAGTTLFSGAQRLIPWLPLFLGIFYAYRTIPEPIEMLEKAYKKIDSASTKHTKTANKYGQYSVQSEKTSINYLKLRKQAEALADSLRGRYMTGEDFLRNNPRTPLAQYCDAYAGSERKKVSPTIKSKVLAAFGYFALI